MESSEQALEPFPPPPSSSTPSTHSSSCYIVPPFLCFFPLSVGLITNPLMALLTMGSPACPLFIILVASSDNSALVSVQAPVLFYLNNLRRSCVLQGLATSFKALAVGSSSTSRPWGFHCHLAMTLPSQSLRISAHSLPPLSM